MLAGSIVPTVWKRRGNTSADAQLSSFYSARGMVLTVVGGGSSHLNYLSLETPSQMCLVLESKVISDPIKLKISINPLKDM